MTYISTKSPIEMALKDLYNPDNIPDYTRAEIDAWIQSGVLPSRFLCSVLENKLKQSYQNADENNLFAIPAIVNYLYNNAPGTCWGSVEAVTRWRESGGMDGEIDNRTSILIT